MPFRLHVVRHAEGTHNPKHDTTILDPPLTVTGVKQSNQLDHGFRFKDTVGLIITSPLRRTVQTTMHGFSSTLDCRYYQDSGVVSGARLVLSADAQAHSARPCDTGSEISVLEDMFVKLPWDEMKVYLDPVFPAKTGLYAPDMETLIARGERLRRDLEAQFVSIEGSDRPDLVLVTHGGMMRFVIGEDWGFGPAQCKSFEVSFDVGNLIVEREI
jgi:broad specificity phosphatase PhoE